MQYCYHQYWKYGWGTEQARHLYFLLTFVSGILRLLGITLANRSILKSGKAKAIRFSTLEEICEILACQPGDILEYMDEDAYNNLMG